jgi:hypothetical protein
MKIPWKTEVAKLALRVENDIIAPLQLCRVIV